MSRKIVRNFWSFVFRCTGRCSLPDWSLRRTSSHNYSIEEALIRALDTTWSEVRGVGRLIWYDNVFFMINLQRVHVLYNIIEGSQQCRWNLRARSTRTQLSIKHCVHLYYLFHLEKGRLFTSGSMAAWDLLVCHSGFNSFPDSQYDTVLHWRYTHMIDQLIFYS